MHTMEAPTIYCPHSGGLDSKLWGLPLCSSLYFGEGGLWGVAGSILEGLKAPCDLGVWKGLGNNSFLGWKKRGNKN